MKAINAIIISIILFFSIGNISAYQTNYYYYNGAYHTIPNYYNSYNYYDSRYCFTRENGRYVECNFGRDSQSSNYNNSRYSNYNNNNYYYDSYYNRYNYNINNPNYWSSWYYNSDLYKEESKEYEFAEEKSSYSTPWSVELNLDFPLWVETLGLEEAILEKRNFKTSQNQKIYQTFVSQDTQMRKLILDLFEKWSLTQAQVNNIIHNYQNFIYYTNQYFYFLSLSEGSLKNDLEVKDWVKNNLKNSKESFTKVKNVILKR